MYVGARIVLCFVYWQGFNLAFFTIHQTTKLKYIHVCTYQSIPLYGMLLRNLFHSTFHMWSEMVKFLKV